MNRFKEQNWNPSIAERRKFGLLLLSGMPASAVLWFLIVRYSTGEWRWAVPAWIVAVGCLFGLLLIALPQVARPFYCVWYFAICIIDTIVTNALLILMYYFMLTPFALFMRMAGRKPLQKGFLPAAKTYWQAAEKITDQSRYFRQF